MYTFLKALHVCAVLIFVGGLLLDSVVLAASRLAVARGAAPSHAVFVAIRRWDRSVTSPAIIATWLLGLTLAALGGWFHAGWLMAKFVIVIVLSAIHGMLSGTLRRAAAEPSDYTPKARDATLPYVVVVGVSLVALLVVIKPF